MRTHSELGTLVEYDSFVLAHGPSRTIFGAKVFFSIVCKPDGLHSSIGDRFDSKIGCGCSQVDHRTAHERIEDGRAISLRVNQAELRDVADRLELSVLSGSA